MATLDGTHRQRNARRPRIRAFVSSISKRDSARISLPTHLPRCKGVGRDIDFVWLMGADNLAQIRHWKHWQAIFARVPIAVFARPTYCRTALAELAAQRFSRARVIRETRRFSEIKPPAWVFLPVRLDFHSATAIRAPKALL